jgi:DNA-binding XRE family transcriptional regulator
VRRGLADHGGLGLRHVISSPAAPAVCLGAVQDDLGITVSAPTDWLPAVGARVRLLRLQRGLSQAALDRVAGVGRGSVHRLEAGRSGVHLTTLWRVAVGLDVYPADLVAEPGNSRLDPAEAR